MNVLVYSHSPPATGTAASSHRIAKHIADSGHDVSVHEHWDVAPPSTDEFPIAQDVDVVVGTHALQSGRALLDRDVRFIIVLSGTDINEHVKAPRERRLMHKAILHAERVITYDRHHLLLASELWPGIREKLVCIPKGVATSPSGFSLRGSLGLSEDSRIYLLPAGLRAVKDVLFLASAIEEWHTEDERVQLVIVGLPREPEYFEAIEQRASESDAITLMPPLRQADLHGAMLDAAAVLNTSRSESSPNAVLEAMHLGCPVIVRNIPGNTELVRHEETGFVFDTPQDFRALASRLDAPAVRDQLGLAAAAYVEAAHTMRAEQGAYARLLEEVDHA